MKIIRRYCTIIYGSTNKEVPSGICSTYGKLLLIPKWYFGVLDIRLARYAISGKPKRLCSKHTGTRWGGDVDDGRRTLCDCLR